MGRANYAVDIPIREFRYFAPCTCREQLHFLLHRGACTFPQSCSGLRASLRTFTARPPQKAPTIQGAARGNARVIGPKVQVITILVERQNSTSRKHTPHLLCLIVQHLHKSITSVNRLLPFGNPVTLSREK